MGLEKTHRYFCAILGNKKIDCQWLFDDRFALEKWPTAEKIIDCTDMPDGDFEQLLLAHE